MSQIHLTEAQVVSLFHQVLAHYMSAAYDTRDEDRSIPEVISQHLEGFDGISRQEWLQELVMDLVKGGGTPSRRGAVINFDLRFDI